MKSVCHIARAVYTAIHPPTLCGVSTRDSDAHGWVPITEYLRGYKPRTFILCPDCKSNVTTLDHLNQVTL